MIGYTTNLTAKAFWSGVPAMKGRGHSMDRMKTPARRLKIWTMGIGATKVLKILQLVGGISAGDLRSEHIEESFWEEEPPYGSPGEI